MNILITGSNGFLGENLKKTLETIEKVKIHTFDKEDSIEKIEKNIHKIDFIFHLAGINRPKDQSEFAKNHELTKEIIKVIEQNQLKIPILFSSSIQAEENNTYGKSKLRAEEILKKYSEKNNVEIYIYRLENIFGKWSKPNYNSVVATFAYNISRDLPIKISDPQKELTLIYVDDVINQFVQNLINKEKICDVNPKYKITLKELSEYFIDFKKKRKEKIIHETQKPLVRALYATFLSYLPENDLKYKINKIEDERGFFAEIIKTKESGQISISKSNPNVKRGNHYHHTKTEKFIVLKGKAEIKIKNLKTNNIKKFIVSEEKYEIIDIPPGSTHSIENIGSDEMILLIWANELFDKKNPDTYFKEI